MLTSLGQPTIRLRLQLHGAIYRPDSFVLLPRYCANLKAIRYESTGLNPGGHSIVKNTGGWLDSLGSGILVGKRYFGVLQKY